MAFQHGKDTVVIIDGKDLSAYANNTNYEKSPDIHDVTTYGKGAHVKRGGLLDGKTGLEGMYDTTALVSPRAVLEPMIGLNKTFIYRPEGTGPGKPQVSVDVVVGKYVQTSPVAEFVKWAVELEFSDVINHAPQ